MSLSEKIDTTTAAGKMVFRMLAVMAEFERDLVAERTKTALTHKISLGERVGSVRFGYTLGDDGKTLVAVADEQEALGIIHELRHRGESLRTIASELDRRGIRPKQGGSKWTHTAVNRILTRTA